MRAALALARRGLGVVWPNPAVGCVLVREDKRDRVVGRGWTQPGGRPHAESEALQRAGQEMARNATAYVTLEPCDHLGDTPPCSQALAAAGVRRAVIAVEDPDPRVHGQGIARLAAAGLAVSTGLLGDEASRLNAGFFIRIGQGRPLITLKVAATLDGRIATHTGASQWITGETARAQAHRLRAEHDAVLIGIGTALADAPRLTCRLPGLEQRSPVRIVVDSRLRLPEDSPLVETARQTPTWVITLRGGKAGKRDALTERGVTVIKADPGPADRPDVGWMVAEFGRRGLTRVLVEGGGGWGAELLRAPPVDRLAWFRAPRLIGGDGMPAAAALGVDDPAQAPEFTRTAVLPAGPDILETYERII